MKILPSDQIRKIDVETIRKEGISSLELMKRAATAFYNFFVACCPDKEKEILIFAGSGNNGGDALAVARLLHHSGYRVKVYMVDQGSRYSDDCAHNLRRVKAEHIHCTTVRSNDDLLEVGTSGVIIDGILGTGLSREIEGNAAKVIEAINASGLPVYSIDVPSGLFLERKTTLAVKATVTVTFQIPKLALFLPENGDFAGEVRIVDIGLHSEAIAAAQSEMEYAEREAIALLLKPLCRFAHKGTQGHVLLVGGSLGKCGSICLAAKAALRSGCGLVTAYQPCCGTSVIQSVVPEAMAMEDPCREYLTEIPYGFHSDAVGIGPGMGQQRETEEAFGAFLARYRGPLVIDADGLNILSRHPEWLSRLSPGTILTPHPKELVRLIGAWRDDFEKIEKTRLLAKRNDLVIVVKGTYSLVVGANQLHVNSSGTPALATAGSGDVLTGMITSLLAQGYRSLDAARVGVYLHGLTADLTRDTIHPLSFMAGDIIEHIGDAYQFVEKRGK
ncbi:MAG: NAD(P)H-hydrate dehydratase [bacterium]|nr:NAD(P)H-hydrate dehydratase [bacterium]